MADLDPGTQTRDAVARMLLDRLSRRQQRSQLADAAFEQRQGVHGIAEVEILGRVVAACARVAQANRHRRQLSLEPRQLSLQLLAALWSQTYRQSCHGAQMLLPWRVPRQFAAIGTERAKRHRR